MFKALFSRAPKPPKAEPVGLNQRNAGITCITDAADQENVRRWVWSVVEDFRSEKDTVGVATLGAVGDKVGVFINRQRVGLLPDFWTEGGLTLLRRAAELGAPSVHCVIEVEWQKKAGPFEVAVALGHSANAERAELVPWSQWQYARWA